MSKFDIALDALADTLTDAIVAARDIESPAMRQPNSAEMIAGIERAITKKLQALEQGPMQVQPERLLASALSLAAHAQIKDWLSAHTHRLMAMIAEKAQVPSDSMSRRLRLIVAALDNMVGNAHDAAVAAADTEEVAYEIRRAIAPETLDATPEPDKNSDAELHQRYRERASDSGNSELYDKYGHLFARVLFIDRQNAKVTLRGDGCGAYVHARIYVAPR